LFIPLEFFIRDNFRLCPACQHTVRMCMCLQAVPSAH
jgi:hypothetical protein